jgi:hypothetical protein
MHVPSVDSSNSHQRFPVECLLSDVRQAIAVSYAIGSLALRFVVCCETIKRMRNNRFSSQWTASMNSNRKRCGSNWLLTKTLSD